MAVCTGTVYDSLSMSSPIALASAARKHHGRGAGIDQRIDGAGADLDPGDEMPVAAPPDADRQLAGLARLDALRLARRHQLARDAMREFDTSDL